MLIRQKLVIILFASLCYFSTKGQSSPNDTILTALRGRLPDSIRASLLKSRLLDWVNEPHTEEKDIDLFLEFSQNQDPQDPTGNRPYWQAWNWLYQGGCQYLLKDTARGRAAIRTGWQVIRRGQRINEEFDYLRLAAYWVAKDTGMDTDARGAFRTAVQDAMSLLHRDDPDKVFDDAISYFIGIANQYDRKGRPALAIDAAQQANLLNKAFDRHNVIPLSFLSGISNKIGNPKEGLHYALEAVRLTETDPTPPRSGFGYSAAGTTYLLLNDIPRSLEYYLKAMEVSYRNPDNSSTPNHNLVRRITIGYLRLGRPADALAFLDTAERKLPARDAAEQRIINDSKADCYFALKRYDQAKKYYLLGLKGAGVSRTFALDDYLSLSEVCFALKQYQEAVGYLTAITADSNHVYADYTARKAALLLFFRTDSALGNFRDAAVQFLRYQRIKDSVFNDSTNRQLQELTAKYETEKKDHSISLMNTNARLRETEVAKSHTIRNALVAISLLLLLLAGLLLNRYRMRQRTYHDLQEMNEKQYNLILEKEWLMGEVHRQAKDNLQLVINLLNMQEGSLSDELTLSAFEEIRNRVHAISLIHERLYREQARSASIDMEEYIVEMVSFLQHGIAPGQRIEFRVDTDAIKLDVSQSVPAGLILNEAVTNAIKYAFPEDGWQQQNGAPSVEVKLNQMADDRVLLVITDNGVGLPKGFDPGKATSLGMQLIRNLSLQLNGSLSLVNGHGLSVRIEFPRA